jgi:hypothetical protein
MSEIARQSTARTFIVGPVLDADGAAVTDGVIADFKLSKNGAAPAAFNGSATLTHRHTGFYSLAATTSDLDTVGSAVATIDDGTNACPPLRITVVEEAVYDALFAASAAGYGTAQTGDSFARLGAPAGASIAADIATVDTVADAIKAKTDSLTFTVAGVIDANVTYVTGTAFSTQGGSNFRTWFQNAGNPSTHTLASWHTNITGIGTDTDAIIAAFGDVPTNVWAAGTRTLTSNGNDPTAAAIASAVRTELTTELGRIDAAVSSRLATASYTAAPTTAQILAAGDVDGYSLENALKLVLAALAGKLSGAATNTVTVRAADDSKARITATVDADGNRSAVTLDATG